MELSPEHIELAETVRRFARDEVAPVIADYYERDEFPYAIVAQMGEMGLFGLPFPEEYGGMGGDYFALCLAIEELARVDQSVAITLEAGVARRHAGLPVRHRGAEAAVAARAVRGTSRSARSASPSPAAGSDAGAHPHHRRLRDGTTG